MMRPSFAIALAVAFAIPTPSGAQEEKLLALQVLEGRLESDYRAMTKELRSKYRDALEKLRDDYMKAGRLEDTLAVKKEIERLDATFGSPDGKPVKKKVPAAVAGEAGSFLLRLEGASLGGPVKLDTEHRLLVDWKKDGYAEWALAEVARGAYTVVLEFHSGPFAGGQLELTEGGASREFDIAGSGKWIDKKQLDMGKVSVSTGGESLRLRVLSARLQGVMELIQIRLLPTSRMPLQVPIPIREPGQPLPEEPAPDPVPPRDR